jgi:hypothetical protein
MPEYQFISGERFSVMANDAEHAREILNAFFNGDWDNNYVTDDDINAVNYIGADTRYISEVEPGKMYNYYTYEEE